MAKQRIDALLVDKGLAPTRSRAASIIMAGRVYVGERKIDKPGTLVPEEATVEVRETDHPYVSRGGVKLAGALDDLAVDPKGLRCLDVGAGTGGFTDVLLHRGAAHVVAVDVGYGQLHASLRADPRVTVLERTNARDLEPEAIGGPVDLIVVDASFIGIGKLAGALYRNLRPRGALVAMIKPQFEIGRKDAARTKGVVRDPDLRRGAIVDARRDLEACGFVIDAQCDSRLAGPKGNVEAFVLAHREC
jgi:23S rRNA (cytidine1920-2'-O)/16S rRNA (cytidine1409-2'-O)-methyltransferase